MLTFPARARPRTLNTHLKSMRLPLTRIPVQISPVPCLSVHPGGPDTIKKATKQNGLQPPLTYVPPLRWSVHQEKVYATEHSSVQNSGSLCCCCPLSRHRSGYLPALGPRGAVVRSGAA